MASSWDNFTGERQNYYGGFPGFDPKLNQNRTQNQQNNSPKVEGNSNIPNFQNSNIRKPPPKQHNFFKLLLDKLISDDKKEDVTKLAPPRTAETLLNMRGHILARYGETVNDKILSMLIGIYDVTRLNTKYQFQSSQAIGGDLKLPKKDNLVSKIDTLNTNIVKYEKAKQAIKKVGKVAGKLTGYDKKDFYNPLNMATQFGGSLAAGGGLAVGSGALGLATLSSVGGLAALIPAMLLYLGIVSKGGHKYGKKQNTLMDEYQKNDQAKGNVITDYLSGDAWFGQQRTDFNSNVNITRAKKQGYVDMVSSARAAQLKSEQMKYYERIDKELKKSGSRYEMMKISVTPSNKVVAGMTTFEGKMISLTSGIYDALRFATLELTALRVGTIGNDKVTSTSLLNQFEQMVDNTTKRQDRVVTNKAALLKNTGKAGLMGGLAGLPFFGLDAGLISAPLAMAAYLGLKTSHSALRAPTGGGKVGRLATMGAVGAGGMAAANSGILNTLGSIGMGGVGAATGLPGVLTAALISMVGVKGIKEGYKAFRNYETDKFKVDEKKIEINEKRQLVRKVNLGLRHSTAQLLATPAVNVLSRLKGKDPHSQHMGMLGVIFDTLRNMGLNLNILRQGTVGDFKAGETILKHFEDSEKARKKREEENEGGFFGKVKRKIVNVKDKVVDKTIGSVKRNWLVGAGGATGGLGLATLLGTGLLASGGIGAVGAIGAKLFANKFKKSKEINEQKLNELRDKASEFKNKLGNKDRKSADSINLATTSLPKIAEQQRVYLAKIY
jgi:hypothetical protein